MNDNAGTVGPLPPRAESPDSRDAAGGRDGASHRIVRLLHRGLALVGVPFFLVACTLTYYGQLHRTQAGDAAGTIYAAVAIVRDGTVFLDDYLPYLQQRFGEKPYMLASGADGHVVNGPPLGASLLAVPLVAVFTLAGTDAGDVEAWNEAAMLTAAVTGAATVAVLFVLLTRLTTRRRAAVIASVYAWGTLAWGINAQSLWQHGPAALALAVGLLMLVDRRYVLAGTALALMVAFRFSTPPLFLLLLPLLGIRPGRWIRFGLGALPVAGGLALYNHIAFSSATDQGYGSGHVTTSATPHGLSPILEAAATLVASPGRGLLVFSPVLLLAFVGAVRGFRTPIYRWSALAAFTYPFVIGNLDQWSGNECFGPRKLAESLPLWAVLIVPAVDVVVRRRALRRLVGVAIAWSVGVQLLGAAMWPPPTWFGDHDVVYGVGVWWHPFDNELVAMLQEPHVAPRLLAMAGLLVGSIAAGLAYAQLVTRRAPASRPPGAQGPTRPRDVT